MLIPFYVCVLFVLLYERAGIELGWDGMRNEISWDEGNCFTVYVATVLCYDTQMAKTSSSKSKIVLEIILGRVSNIHLLCLMPHANVTEPKYRQMWNVKCKMVRNNNEMLKNRLFHTVYKMLTILKICRLPQINEQLTHTTHPHKGNTQNIKYSFELQIWFEFWCARKIYTFRCVPVPVSTGAT